MSAVSLLARPKINLFLHVTGKRPDGYHLLESLAVFAETGDRIHAEPSTLLSLSLGGPFAIGLSASGDNLVLRAALALQGWVHAQGGQAPGAALHLEKRLPLASGIGGGSADAAATLLLLRDLWALEIGAEALARIARTLGADVSVCLDSRARIMRGTGGDLSEPPVLPRLWLVLVNPGQQISTPAVFAGLQAIRPDRVAVPDTFHDAQELAGWLEQETRNDLEAPARIFAPGIAAVLEAVTGSGALLARMSGSGATCYGLFADRPSALAAEAELRALEPRWWIEAAAVSQPAAVQAI